MRRLALALAALAALQLAACTPTVAIKQEAEQVEQVEQVSKPRQRIEVLARMLAEIKEGLGEERRAGKLDDATFKSTFPLADRASQRLNEAGRSLHLAADDKAMAATIDTAEKVTYIIRAGAFEAFAISRAKEAEVDIYAMRDILTRVRGIVPPPQ